MDGALLAPRFRAAILLSSFFYASRRVKRNTGTACTLLLPSSCGMDNNIWVPVLISAFAWISLPLDHDTLLWDKNWSWVKCPFLCLRTRETSWRQRWKTMWSHSYHLTLKRAVNDCACPILDLSRSATHSRLERPRSFWSAPRIAASGKVQHQKSTIHGFPVTLLTLRVKFDKSDSPKGTKRRGAQPLGARMSTTPHISYQFFFYKMSQESTSTHWRPWNPYGEIQTFGKAHKFLE